MSHARKKKEAARDQNEDLWQDHPRAFVLISKLWQLPYGGASSRVQMPHGRASERRQTTNLRNKKVIITPGP